jgi:RNA-directed DNA polymerase
LVRYADDFVVMARYQGPRIDEWLDAKLEGWLGLTINREKTKVVNLDQAESLDFLGFTFRYDRDLFGSGKTYLNVVPSKKSLNSRATCCFMRGPESRRLPFTCFSSTKPPKTGI